MSAVLPATAVGVFVNRASAERAVEELRHAGFSDEDIGFIARKQDPSIADEVTDRTTTDVADVGITGAVTGGTIGTLAGLAVAAGLVPPLGPVIFGGTVVALLASAATGAAVGGGFGVLMGLGLPEQEARNLELELQAGRFLVTVRTKNRYERAVKILRRQGALGEGSPLI